MGEGFLATTIKLFFLLTPFFALSAFSAFTEDCTPKERRDIAVRCSISNFAISLIVYFLGTYIFRLFGVTLDAFRIGAGIILLVTAINLVNSKPRDDKEPMQKRGDIAVVPLSIPNTIGPGTIGALMVMSAGADSLRAHISDTLGILLAVGAVSAMLLTSNSIERLIQRKGIQILSKITGLMLAALASQLIMTGVKNIMKE